MEEENEFKEKVNELFDTKSQLGSFDYDSYNWGCLRYMIELWIFLCRRRKQGLRTIPGFFSTVLLWLAAREELKRYDGQDYTAASMLMFLLFTIGDLIAHITDCMDFDDLERYHVVLFTKCYFGNHRFPRTSKEMESQKFTRFDKKILRTATKWAGFNLMLYVLYGLGFVNILEDMKVEYWDSRTNIVRYLVILRVPQLL